MNAVEIAARFSVGVVDRTRWYLPESLTPLAHTAVYAELPEPVRRRYNQLFASCYHEHFIFLERVLSEPLLPAIVKRLAGDPLEARLRRFVEEERAHTQWFHRLHRASEPGLYGKNLYHFVRVPAVGRIVFEACARRPWRFPFCLWLAMIIEERTLPAARDILREADRLEPHYVVLHRLHAADEAGHVSCDAELLKRIWPTLSRPMRALNRWLFVAMLREFFQLPKRAGWRVVQRLAEECPSVVPLLPRLRRELLALGGKPDYLVQLYSRRREPRTFALADGFVEMRRLEEAILGEHGARGDSGDRGERGEVAP